MSDTSSDVPLDQLRIQAQQPKSGSKIRGNGKAPHTKREVTSSDDDFVRNGGKKRPLSKSQAPSENKPGKRSGAPKGKGAPKENKAQPKAAAAQTRIKKEYELPGQTRDIPPENDGLRRFYTTLLEQKPRSEMARKYCVMYGLLSRAEAEAWVEEQARRKGRSPTKMVPKKKRLSNVEKGAGRTKEKLKRKKPDANSVEEGPVNGGKISSIQSIQPRKAKTNRDVAFVDGGLGDSSDSDSDIPLIMFKNKQKAT